jgi:starch synthase
MEVEPFLKITSAAPFIRKLPQGLQDHEHEIRILMPKFGIINERRNRLHEVVRLSGINIRVGGQEKPLTIKVATIPSARLQVYFLDNEDYFKRKHVLTDKKGFFPDNDERAIFFAKGVLETVKKLGWSPNVVHCHGWMTSLIPLYLRTHYKDDPNYANSKVVYTLYNNPLDAPLPEGLPDKARLEGISDEAFAPYLGPTFADFALGGTAYADYATKGHEKVSDVVEARAAEKGISLPFDGNGQDEAAYVQYYHQLYLQHAGLALATAE